MSAPIPADWYRDPELIQRVVAKYGSFRKAADATGADRGGIARWWRRHELPPFKAGPEAVTPLESLATAAPDGVDGDALLAALRKAKEATVPELADLLDTSPNRIRQAAQRLRGDGYRIDLREGGVRLERIPPATTSLHDDLLPLLDGKLLRFGVVSDTHISSIEEALPELHAAYDYFEREGVSTVLHAGDWTCGYGIYPQQISEVKEATATGQAERLKAEYPHRPGVQTIGIAGNHDLEGVFGRAGYDPVAAAFQSRPDVTYLGGYDAFLRVGAEELGDAAPWVNLRHGKGGMSYAYSYKAQKLVEGIPAGRKPAIFIPGHWHVKGSFEARSVQVLFPGCFEWASTFMRRLGLQPAVGFHIVEATVGADGSLVAFMPRWFKFYEGRVVG